MKTFDPNLDPIEKKDFIEVLNAMNEVFSGINKVARIQLYYSAVKDLPLKAVKEISQTFLMGFKNVPTPNDFLEAATAWKRKNGFYLHDESGAPILCSRCGDLGVLVLSKRDSVNYETLINCPCQHGVCKDLRAPRWKNDLAAGFSYSKCPVDWFKPEEVSDENLVLNKSFYVKVSEWKTKKNEASEYWKILGYDHDRDFK